MFLKRGVLLLERESLQEPIPHGNALLPLMVHVFETGMRLRKRVVCHWHEELEFLVVTDGEADFHIDAQHYRVTTGDVLFVNSNRLHSALAVENTPFRFFAVVFHSSLLDNSVNDSVQQKYITPVLNGQVHFPAHLHPQAKWEQTVLACLRQIKEVYEEHQPAYELTIS
jgi:quercetin dioxygenase-like cupin family protein